MVIGFVDLRDLEVGVGRGLRVADTDDDLVDGVLKAPDLVPMGARNAKYSPGGLVDTGCYVQARQIEVGHKEPNVRQTNTLRALEALEGVEANPLKQAAEIPTTYRLLRRVIDALRVVRGNAQDLTVPQVESREFAYLARRLGFKTARQLQTELERRMTFASRVWGKG